MRKPWERWDAKEKLDRSEPRKKAGAWLSCLTARKNMLSAGEPRARSKRGIRPSAVSSDFIVAEQVRDPPS